MKKFGKIRVLAPLNFGLYVGALWVTAYYPGWGSLALALMDLVTIVVIYLIARRYIEVHQRSSWEQIGPRLVYPFAILIGLALIHMIGVVVKDDEQQRLLAYGSVTLIALAAFVYVMQEGKAWYWGD